MTASSRIALNVIATYGRSLFQTVCAMFTARWVLLTLGEVDYGLYGLIGGLTAFLSFLNNYLATAVGRFYAYAIGEAKKYENALVGLGECRKWFGVAVILHTAIPIIMTVMGLFTGIWAINNYLDIPQARLMACHYVWICVCISCFVSMMNVPFRAMYVAKQNIAELTLYDFIATTLNVVVLYYMVTHPSDWLVRYAMWMMFLSVIPQLVMGIRAFIIYPECRFVRDNLFDWMAMKQILSFSGYQLLNGFSMILANQGQSVVINKYVGASANAAMSVGNHVAAHTQSLATAIAGAFSPAVTNLAGEGKLDAMRKMALRASKFGTLSLLMFAIPLCLEIHLVMELWLKNPPEYAATLCSCLLVAMVLDKLSSGHWMSIFAIGDIGGYQLAACIPSFFAFFFGWYLVARGMGLVGVGVAIAASKIFTNIIRVPFGRRVSGITMTSWLKSVVFPVSMVAIFTMGMGLLIRINFHATYWRIFITSLSSFLAFCISTWFVGLNGEERKAIRKRIIRLAVYKWLHDVKVSVAISWTQIKYRCVLSRLCKKVRSGRKLKVIFLVHVSSKWKCQSLYDWLKNHPMYQPVVGLDIDVKSPEMKNINLSEEWSFYQSRGCMVENVDHQEFEADLVFYQEPFGNRQELLPFVLSSKALTFYVPYYVATHDTWQRACLVERFHGFLFRQFAPSKAWADYYMSHVSMFNYGGKILGLGHPMLDLIKAPNQQGCTTEKSQTGYIIYAPHFSFRNDKIPITIDISTFQESGQKILSYAKAHTKFNWLFKPHPRLRWFLSASGFMTEGEVAEYYKAWEDLGTVCYDGTYTDYFNKSKVMITDCSSFLGEYSATGNPIIHLVYGHDKDDNNKPACVVKSLFESFYTVQDDRELDEVLVQILEAGEDPKKDQRSAATREVGFVGQFAADNIGKYINTILGISTKECD